MAKNRSSSRVQQPSSIPLFVVCGLPLATDVLAEKSVSDAFGSHCKVMHLGSTTSDGSVYSEDYVRQVLKSITAFTHKRRNPKENVVTPSRIVLFYVPAAGSERLLKSLDFAVFPVGLTELATWSDQGKMRRHESGAVVAALQEAVKFLKANHAHFDRVKHLRPTDAMLLPPRNFLLDRDTPIETLFAEMRTGIRPWEDRFSELEPTEFQKSALPKMPSQVGRFFKDARDVVFMQPHATAFHGGPWLVDDAGGLTQLRALYRFGGALPHGFQHDAQYEGGAKLHKVVFDCAIEGRIEVSDDHADIYPNDVVRHRTKK